MRAFLLLTMAFTMVSAVFLFRIKHEVLDLERHIATLQRTIRQRSRDIVALQSELSYLTRPQRIHRLGQQYFPHWTTLQPQQLVQPSLTDAPSSGGSPS